MGEAQERLQQLEATLAAIAPVWSHVADVLKEKADSLTLELIGQENEQTRGRIKALRELMNLPETLHQEREGIKSGLAD